MRIEMVRPDITIKEAYWVSKAVTEGEISPKSKYVPEFEERLADYLGFKYAVACNSGYSAILLATRALELKEIIVPTLTMVASATGAKHAGAKVEFCDVNERGLMEGRYGKPIMTVDLYGKLATARSDIIVEDAAEAFGKLPYYGTIVCFSFYVNKFLTTGNGGACLTNDEGLAKEMKLLRHHYYDGTTYIHLKDGYNVSMTGMQAAMGIAQLERMDQMMERRKQLGERYVKELGAWECDAYWYQPFICKTKSEKESLKQWLDWRNIATRDFFTPLHTMPFCWEDKEFPTAQSLSERGILLPLYSAMTDKEQTTVIKAVKEFYAQVKS